MILRAARGWPGRGGASPAAPWREEEGATVSVTAPQPAQARETARRCTQRRTLIIACVMPTRPGFLSWAQYAGLWGVHRHTCGDLRL